MRTFTLSVAVTLALTWAGSAFGQSLYRLEGALGVHPTVRLHPSSVPPAQFVHWDLREFPSCQLPYALNENGHADSDPGNEFIAMDDAVDSWDAVAPAIVDFTATPLFTAIGTWANDNVNVFTFDNNLAANLAQWGAAPSGVIALTCVFTNANYETQEADIVFNDRDWQWNTAGNNTANWVFTANMQPYALANGQTLTVSIDGGAAQTVTFNTGSFVNIAAATHLEVAAVINAQLAGSTAAAFANPPNAVGIQSNSAYNGGHSVNVTGGTANGALGFPVGLNVLRSVDVETIAVHEVGHFLGITHSAAGGPPGGPVMVAGAPATGTKRALTAEDQQALNFLYTPDLGDAPDPNNGVFNEYQSLVHSTVPLRMLNAMQLFTPALGPVHLFGYSGPAPYAADRFEWLGVTMDDHPSECESRQVDDDDFDDGVAMPQPLLRGEVNRITVTVTHSARLGRYNDNDDVCLAGGGVCPCGASFVPQPPAVPFIGPGANGGLDTPLNNCPNVVGNDTVVGGQITTGPDLVLDTFIPGAQTAKEELLFVNGYLDFPADDLFDPGERELWWQGRPAVAAGPGGVPQAVACTTVASSANLVSATCLGNVVTLEFDVLVPIEAADEFYCRYRLDYGEDEGAVANYSGDLGRAVGAAQFGEVEDYPCTTERITWVFTGTPLGGSVDFVIEGVLLSVPTFFGDTLEDVADAVAAAINNDLDLQALGIFAVSEGNAVSTNGIVQNTNITDPGIDHKSIPALSPMALLALAMILIATAAMISGRRRRRSV